MKNEFIPYEQALELKELRFYEPCFGYYIDVEVPNPFLVTTKISDTQGGYFTFAPTFSQAFRWFREKYNLLGIVSYCDDNSGKFMSVIDKINSDIDYDMNAKDTYEEAELACLIKLIEIVKNK